MYFGFQKLLGVWLHALFSIKIIHIPRITRQTYSPKIYANNMYIFFRFN